MCLHVTMSGQLALDINNIVFCPASNTTSSPDQTIESSDSGSSPKCRKYTSYAPPRVPVSSTSAPTAVTIGVTMSAPSENVAGSSTSLTAANQRRVFQRLFFFFLLTLLTP